MQHLIPINLPRYFHLQQFNLLKCSKYHPKSLFFDPNSHLGIEAASSINPPEVVWKRSTNLFAAVHLCLIFWERIIFLTVENSLITEAELIANFVTRSRHKEVIHWVGAS